MSRDDLSTYTELADVLADLPRLVKAERRRRQISIRATAAEIGCAASTISRIETGHDCALSAAKQVLRWLDAAGQTGNPT